MDWEKLEVVLVSGKEVTLLKTGQFINGTAMPHSGDIYAYDLETGTTNETHSDLKSIMAANLNEGNGVPPGTFIVNKTEIRAYFGVSRIVNILIEEMSTDLSTTRLTVIYDKVSGMALESETWTTALDTGVKKV